MGQFPPDSLAVVTGAGSGIGRATAVALGALGLKILLIGRRAIPLKGAADDVDRAGGQAHVLSCDITADDSATAITAMVNDLDCPLVALIHSAGRYCASKTQDTNLGELQAVFACNVWAPIILTQHLLPALRAARGDIVFVNSSAVTSPRAETGTYAASKSALKTLADSIRQGVNDDGVRVLSIFPGRTATPMQQEVHRREGRDYKPELLLHPADIASAIVSAIILPKRAEVTDIHIRPAMRA